MKPYQNIPIEDCGEPLVPLPQEEFAVVQPHPYAALGAPYGDRSPYWLRRSVLAALQAAQRQLQVDHAGWRIQIFDAYRPIAVQQFMVDHTAQSLSQERGLDIDDLSEGERQALMERVHQFWASPSTNPKTPPPHSTGAAVDVTLVDGTDEPINMGAPIDEVSGRSHPDYYQAREDSEGQSIHAHRCLLRRVMISAGFQQHPNEWWHFSLGDQLWAWSMSQLHHQPYVARYGGIEHC